MFVSSLVLAVVLAQTPGSHPPVATARHHKAGESVEKRLDALALDLVGYGEIIVDLQRQVAELKRHRCHCQDHAAKPKAPAVSTPACEWREVIGVPGLHYYGYLQDGVFHVLSQRYDGPPVVRRQAGCARGSCP